MSEQPHAPPRGPRGGKTTVSRGGTLIRKVFLLGVEEAEELRLRAFRQRRSEASIVREVLRRHLGVAGEATPGEG